MIYDRKIIYEHFVVRWLQIRHEKHTCKQDTFFFSFLNDAKNDGHTVSNYSDNTTKPIYFIYFISIETT